MRFKDRFWRDRSFCIVDGFGVVVVDLSVHCLVTQHSNVVCDQMDGTVGDTMS
jgi:hypothetical protein